MGTDIWVRLSFSNTGLWKSALVPELFGLIALGLIASIIPELNYKKYTRPEYMTNLFVQISFFKPKAL